MVSSFPLITFMTTALITAFLVLTDLRTHAGYLALIHVCNTMSPINVNYCLY